MILQMQSVGPINVQEGGLLINLPLVIPNPVGAITAQTLVQNANSTVTVQAGASYCIIQPNVSNTQLYTVKGIAGDTGIVASAATAPQCVNIGAMASFVIFLAAGSNQAFSFVWL